MSQTTSKFDFSLIVAAAISVIIFSSLMLLLLGLFITGCENLIAPSELSVYFIGTLVCAAAVLHNIKLLVTNIIDGSK